MPANVSQANESQTIVRRTKVEACHADLAAHGFYLRITSATPAMATSMPANATGVSISSNMA